MDLNRFLDDFDVSQWKLCWNGTGFLFCSLFTTFLLIFRSLSHSNLSFSDPSQSLFIFLWLNSISRSLSMTWYVLWTLPMYSCMCVPVSILVSVWECMIVYVLMVRWVCACVFFESEKLVRCKWILSFCVSILLSIYVRVTCGEEKFQWAPLYMGELLRIYPKKGVCMVLCTAVQLCMYSSFLCRKET